MKPAAFELHRPERIEDALAILASPDADAKIIAGGQSLVPLMNLRMASPATLVDIGRVLELRGIRVADDHLVIGAMTRQADLLEDARIATHAPLLRLVAAHIGHVQTRARGTVGGSLAHADPAAELPTAMVALDATFTLRSQRGTRHVPARGFFTGMLTTELAEDELLCEIAIPCAAPETRVSFRELARRHGDFAIVSAAVQFDPRGAGLLDACLGGILPAPHLCSPIIQSLGGAPYAPDVVREAVRRELDTLEPTSDIHASGTYRRHLAGVLLEQGVRDVLDA